MHLRFFKSLMIDASYRVTIDADLSAIARLDK